MARKAPRRTTERILEAALDLFNRFGEPNVSTAVVAAELGINPGNLHYHYHYHYPAKAEIVNALSQRYALSLQDLFETAGDVREMQAAWGFFLTLFERLWDYRFLYRDINDLLSRNRTLETQFRVILQSKAQAVRQVLDALRTGGALAIKPEAIEPTTTSMLVVLTYWLNFESVRDPRREQESAQVQHALAGGSRQVLRLLAPYLEPKQCQHLLALMRAHASEDGVPPG